MDCFETAAIPGQSEESKKRLLHFVVAGGGPTGVESAAELHDFVKVEVPRYFPKLAPYVKISLVEMLPNVLGMFDKVRRSTYGGCVYCSHINYGSVLTAG